MDRLLSRVLLLLAALVALRLRPMPLVAGRMEIPQADHRRRGPAGRWPVTRAARHCCCGCIPATSASTAPRMRATTFASSRVMAVPCWPTRSSSSIPRWAWPWSGGPAGGQAAAPQTIWMYYGNESPGQRQRPAGVRSGLHAGSSLCRGQCARDTTAYGNNAGAVVPPSEGAVIGVCSWAPAAAAAGQRVAGAGSGRRSPFRPGSSRAATMRLKPSTPAVMVLPNWCWASRTACRS